MTLQVIPVSTSPYQSFDYAITINGVLTNFHFNINYNMTAHYWVMTVSNASTLEILIDSLPLVVNGNLLEQYDYLQIGSAYIYNWGNVAMDSPDDTNLGTDFQLIWDDNK